MKNHNAREGLARQSSAHSKRIKSRLALMGLAVASMVPVSVLGSSGTGDVTLIHTGDIHGHLLPRANLRSDGIGHSMEGGVARMYTKIKEIRAASPNSLLINTGDTVQGSGEALFSRGQAMIDVLNLFGFDAHAPGNWDFTLWHAAVRGNLQGCQR